MEQALDGSILILVPVPNVTSSSSSLIDTFQQKTQDFASMSFSTLSTLLTFSTNGEPVEPYGASTEICSEKWDGIEPVYFSKETWSPLIRHQFGQRRYEKFVRAMVRRISYNTSNETEIRAFSNLLLCDDNHNYLWLALPGLPDIQDPP